MKTPPVTPTSPIVRPLRGRSFSLGNRFGLAAACASVLAAHSGQAEIIYWDGSGGTSWATVGSWSTSPTATTPDPAAVPGASDIATFVTSTVTAAPVVNLNANRSVLGLATTASNTFTTSLRGGGTNRILNLGTDGINHIGGGLTIGSSTGGQQVAISLQGAQTWTSSSTGTGAAGIVVVNGVSIGAGGDQLLTLAGTNSNGTISGAISNGAATLSIGKSGGGTWILSGANSYTGLTAITGGALRVQNASGLGTTDAGTTVVDGGALQLSNNVSVAGEALTISGNGVSANTGAFRNITGNNTWGGNLTVAPASITRVASDADLLTISGNVALSTTAADQFVLQGNGDGLISGTISGVSRVTKGGLGAGTWTLSGANTYTGRTVITAGSVSAASLNSVTGGSASSSLGAPTTVADGTIDLGGNTSTGRLLYTGAGETTDRVINLAGSTGGGVIDQSGSGVLKFTSAITAIAGSKTLTLQGSTSGTGEFSGAIGDGAGVVSVTKTGTGTWTLSGLNTFSGGTNVNNGTLIADLSVNNTGVLSAAGAVSFGGGTLKVLGASSGTSTQAIASLGVTAGQNRLVIDPNGGTSTTLTITSPAVTTGAGSRLEIDYAAGTTLGGTAGNNVVTWSADLTSGIIGTGYVVKDAGGRGFATVVGGNVLRLIPTLGLPQAGASATENYILNADSPTTTPGSLNLTQTNSQTINTLTVDTSATAGTLALGATVLNLNGIMVDGASSNSFTISGAAPGGLQAASVGGNLVVEQHAGGTLTVSAPILDNGGSGLIKNGASTLVLSGANTYTGATVLNAGTTRFSGTMGASPVTINFDAVAQIGVSTGLTAANSVTFGAASTGRFQLNGNSATIGTLTTNAIAGAPIVENASATEAAFTVTAVGSTSFSGVIRDGAGGGALGLTLTGGTSSVMALSGSEANTHTGLTTVTGPGFIADFSKAAGNAVGGDLTISGGARVRFTQSNQIADSATVRIMGAGSAFNGNGVNVAPLGLNETFANLVVTGGAVSTGAGAGGFNITGETSFTGGAENTIFVGNSGAQFTTQKLSLTNMTATPGSTVETNNSFTLYGNNTGVRSRLTVGAGGLFLDGSVLNLRRGGTGAQGSRLILDGDVTTTGTAASRIHLDTAGGTNGAVSVDLSSTSGTVNRTFNVGGGGADLTVNVPMVNGAATTGGISKAGVGTLTLDAVNTYTGATNVNAGTLLVSGSISASTVTVGDAANPATSARLGGGTGAVSATPTFGAISGATPGAVIDPGMLPNTAGVLNTNTFSLSNSAHLSLQIGGVSVGGNLATGYDRINVLSTTLSADVSAGTLDLMDITGGGLMPADALLFILVNNGSGAPSSLFSNVTLGGVPVTDFGNIVIGNMQFALVNNADFTGGGTYGGAAIGGNDIALVAVPEPASAVTLLAGMASLLGLRRFRRRMD